MCLLLLFRLPVRNLWWGYLVICFLFVLTFFRIWTDGGIYDDRQIIMSFLFNSMDYIMYFIFIWIIFFSSQIYVEHQFYFIFQIMKGSLEVILRDPSRYVWTKIEIFSSNPSGQYTHSSRRWLSCQIQDDLIATTRIGPVYIIYLFFFWISGLTCFK